MNTVKDLKPGDRFKFVKYGNNKAWRGIWIKTSAYDYSKASCRPNIVVRLVDGRLDHTSDNVPIVIVRQRKVKNGK
jgi:hypothetical protein